MSTREASAALLVGSPLLLAEAEAEAAAAAYACLGLLVLEIVTSGFVL